MLIKYNDKSPIIGRETFIAPNCTLIGRCHISDYCSIWFNAVLRADINEIKVGKNTNIQDGAVVHCDRDYGTYIGENVTVGHNAIVHGCTIGSNCIVGMGSTILDGAKIGDNSIVGANALVTSGKEFPAGSLIMGSPAKVVRALSDDEIAAIRHSSEGYVHLMKTYMNAML